MHGAVLAAVAAEVALPIAVDIEAPHHARTGDGLFPDPGVDGVAPPGDVTRQADIDRKQPAHRPCLPQGPLDQPGSAELRSGGDGSQWHLGIG